MWEKMILTQIIIVPMVFRQYWILMTQYNIIRITRIDKKRFDLIYKLFKILREYEKSIDNLNKSIEIKENHETYFLLANVYRNDYFQ